MKTIWKEFDNSVRAIVPLFETEIHGVAMLQRLCDAIFLQDGMVAAPVANIVGKRRAMFSNILLPTDGSSRSMKAVKAGIKLAKEQRARVTAFYVGPEWLPTVFISEHEHALMMKKLSDRYLGRAQKAASAAGVRCACLRAFGNFPYVEIVKAAKKNRCDLICMASHGRRGLSRLLLGSQTSKVLALSPIPVLVVK